MCLDALGNPTQFVIAGHSQFWDTTLTTGEVAQLLGAICFTFCLVFCFRLVKLVILNNR